jgi:hypothetical protein
MNLKDIKPIEGFHVMEFIRKARKRTARKTKGMTPEQITAYYNSVPDIFPGKAKPYKPS